MRKFVVFTTVLLSVVLLVSILLYGSYRPAPPAPLMEEVASVDRISADGGTRSADIPESFERIPVYSKLSDLDVAKVSVSVGETVREGQVLAELDDAPLLSELRGLQETVRLAEKKLREASVLGGEEEERLKRLLDEARGDLADVQMRMGYRYVVAPTAGVVLERNANPGEPVARGAAPFVIGRPVPRRSPDVPPASGD